MKRRLIVVPLIRRADGRYLFIRCRCIAASFRANGDFRVAESKKGSGSKRRCAVRLDPAG